MANAFWDTIKSLWQKKDTSAGSTGTGVQSSPTSTSSNIVSYDSGIQGTRDYASRNMDAFQNQYKLATQAGLTTDQFSTQYKNGIRWADKDDETTPRIRQYNSGIQTTREYAAQNMPELRTQQKLATQAGLSMEEFAAAYKNGARWRDDTKPQITSYNSGIQGTRETAAADMDEFKRQRQYALAAGYTDQEFGEAYKAGTRWRESAAIDQLNQGSGKQDILSKLTSAVNDSEIYNRIADWRLKRWQEKYGDAVHADDFAGQFGANYGAGFLSQELDRAYNDLADNPMDEHDRAYIEKLENLLNKFQTNNQAALDDENVQLGWVSKHLAGYLPQLAAEVLPAAGIAGVAAVSAGAVALTGGAALIPAVTGAAGTAWNAFRIARTAASAMNAFEVTRGASYSALVKTGTNADVARKASTQEAVISSLIEMGDTAFEMFGKIPYLGKIIGGAGEKEIAKTAGAVLKSWAGNTIQEGAEEFFQEILSIANETRVATGEVDGGILGLFNDFVRMQLSMVGGIANGSKQEEWSRALEAGKGGAIIGGLMGGAHIAGGQINQRVNNIQTVRALTEMSQNPNSLGGYTDTQIDQYVQRAESKGTEVPAAVEALKAEQKRREDYRRAIAKEQGREYTVYTEEEKAKRREALDQTKPEDITPDKVDTRGLYFLYDEARWVGATEAMNAIWYESSQRANGEYNKTQTQQAQQTETAPVQQEQQAEIASEQQPDAYSPAILSQYTEEQLDQLYQQAISKGDRYAASAIMQFRTMQRTMSQPAPEQFSQQPVQQPMTPSAPGQQPVTPPATLPVAEQPSVTPSVAEQPSVASPAQQEQEAPTPVVEPSQEATIPVAEENPVSEKEPIEAVDKQRQKEWLSSLSDEELKQQLAKAQQDGDSDMVSAIIAEQAYRRIRKQQRDQQESARRAFDEWQRIKAEQKAGKKPTAKPKKIDVSEAWSNSDKRPVNPGDSRYDMPPDNMPPERLREITAASSRREQEEAFGKTDIREEENNYKGGPIDDTAFSPLTGEPIPVSLAKDDVDAFAEKWGLTDDEKTELVNRLNELVGRYGEKAVFGLGQGTATNDVNTFDKDSKYRRKNEQNPNLDPALMGLTSQELLKRLEAAKTANDESAQIRIRNEFRRRGQFDMAENEGEAFPSNAEQQKPNSNPRKKGPDPDVFASSGDLFEDAREIANEISQAIGEKVETPNVDAYEKALKENPMPSTLAEQTELQRLHDRAERELEELKDWLLPDRVADDIDPDAGIAKAALQEINSAFSSGASTTKTVGNRTISVYKSESSTEGIESYTIPGTGDETCTLFTFPGGHFLSPDVFGESFTKFKKVLSKFGVRDIILTDVPFTKVLGSAPAATRFSRGSSFMFAKANDTQIALYVFGKGTPLHEVEHQISWLAMAANQKKFDKIMRSIFDEKDGLFDPKDLRKMRRRVEKIYAGNIDAEVDERVSGFERRHPHASGKILEYYRRNCYLGVRDSIVLSEVLSRVSAKQGGYGAEFSAYTKALVNSSQFGELLRLAGAKSGASLDDIEFLRKLYIAASDLAGERGLDFRELLDVINNISSGTKKEDNENGRTGHGRNGQDELYRRRESLSAGTSGQRRILGRRADGNGEYTGGVAGVSRSPDRSGTLPHTDSDYQATFGNEKTVPIEKRAWVQNEVEGNAPRDVTAEEREFAREQQRLDEEAKAVRADETAKERRERMLDRNPGYTSRDNASNVFMGAAKLATAKFKFETEDVKNGDRAAVNLTNSLNNLREMADDVANGRRSAYELAATILDMKKRNTQDRELAEFFFSDNNNDKQLVSALESVVEAYEDAVDTGSEHAAKKYSYAAAKAMQMLGTRMQRRSDAMQMGFDMQAEALGKYRRKGLFNTRSDGFVSRAANFLQRMQIAPTNVLRGFFGGFDKDGGTIGYKLGGQADENTKVHQRVIAKSQMAFTELAKRLGKAFTPFATEKDVRTINVAGVDMKLSQQQAAAMYKAARTLYADIRRNIRSDISEIHVKDAKGDVVGTFYLLDDEGNQRRLEADDLKDIQRSLWSNLDDVTKDYLDVYDDVMEELGKQNADVEEKVNGFRSHTYKKGDYIPIKYDPKNKTGSSVVDDDGVQFGFTQERSRWGAGAVVVQPIGIVTDRYINQSANHIAYAEFGDNFKIMNQDTANGRGLAQMMGDTYGETWKEWMNNYVRDLNDFNPREKTDGVSTMLRKGRQAVQTGALVGSVSVPLKQISSYWAASGKIRPGILFRAYHIKIGKGKGMANGNLLYEYRKIGGIDPTLSEVMNSEGLWSRMKSKSSLLRQMEKWIPAMDLHTVDNLYTACAMQVKEDNPKLDVKSEAYQKMVADLFEDVVVSTQPIFTRNARAEYARTDSEFIKLFSMFRTQQTQNLNQIMQAIGEYRAAKGKPGEMFAQRRMTDVIKGQAASAVSLALLTSIADVALHKLRKYKDDDDELDAEKIIERIGLNAVESAAGTLWFADSALKYAIDTINKARGKDSYEFYGVNMGIVTTIGNVADSFGNLVSNPTLSNLKTTASYISQTMGIPLNNAYVLINSAIMYSKDAVGYATGEGVSDYDDILKYLDKEIIASPFDSEKDRTHVMVNAYLKGNESKADRIGAGFKDQSELNTNIRSEAKSRYLDGKITKDQSENLLLRYTTMTQEEVDKKNDLWEFIKNNPRYDDVSESFVEKYSQYAEPADIPVNQFYEYMKRFNNTKGIDNDGDGESDISRQDQMLEYINSLPLTKEQKDMLWSAFGYSTTTKAFKNRPWK